MWPLLASILPGLLDKLIPDPQAAADAKLKAIEMAQRGELAQLDADMKLALGQLEVNKAEAASGNAYASSWRPTIGYICAAGLAWNFLLHPLLMWFSAAGLIHLTGAPPPLVGDNLMELVLGMLGLAGLRSWEKTRGAVK